MDDVGGLKRDYDNNSVRAENRIGSEDLINRPRKMKKNP